MENLRQLLAVIAALTLLLSAVSGTSPNYFAGYVAFADDDEDNSGSSYDDDNGEEEEHEENDEANEQKTVATFGTSSKVELEVEDHVEDDGAVKADLEVETEDGDLGDAEYAIMFNCTTPDVEKLFDAKLVVEDGRGNFEGELLLVNGTTYEGCEVDIGDGLTVPLSTFMVNVGLYDETKDKDEEEKEKDRENGRGDDDDEEKDDDDDDDDGDREYHERDRRAGLEAEDDGAEIKVKVRGLNMSDGTYDAVFSCEDPETEMTIPGGFEVEDGEGELEAEVALANGTYSGCEVYVGDEVMASFVSFTVSEENVDDEVSDKRKEKRRDIVSRLDGNEMHKRRLNANPASPGDYDPGWNYTLVANGTAGQTAIEDEAEANVTIDLGVWKSNRALVLFSVLNGTVEVGEEVYDVELGYALYSVNHNVMRLFAFVTDESGDIYKLKLRGHAAEDSEFPDSSGESIEMIFGGNSGPGRNSLNHEWELYLEGTIEAN